MNITILLLSCSYFQWRHRRIIVTQWWLIVWWGIAMHCTFPITIREVLKKRASSGLRQNKKPWSKCLKMAKNVFLNNVIFHFYMGGGPKKCFLNVSCQPADPICGHLWTRPVLGCDCHCCCKSYWNHIFKVYVTQIQHRVNL